MVRSGVGLVLIPALLADPAAARQPDVAADTIAVIVHPDVARTTMGMAEVRRIFLRREQFWPDQRRVEPVNLPASSAVRDAFSRRVLGRAPRDLAAYWNDLYFHGTAPPAVLDSERATLLFVARTPGAIGYVRLASLRSADTVADVRVVLLIPP